jgi:ribosomal protein S11
MKKKLLIFKTNIALNNIFITITDSHGNVLLKKSSGSEKFKNSKKKNTLAASEITKSILKDLKKSNIEFGGILVKIESHKFPELYSIMKQIKDFKFLNIKKKNTKKKKKNIYNSRTLPIFYIRRFRLKSHNGIRKRKARRT